MLKWRSVEEATQHLLLIKGDRTGFRWLTTFLLDFARSSETALDVVDLDGIQTVAPFVVRIVKTADGCGRGMVCERRLPRSEYVWYLEHEMLLEISEKLSALGESSALDAHQYLCVRAAEDVEVIAVLGNLEFPDV